MASGQITIEFVLILIVVMVIITTVSIPLIQYASDTLQDTGNAVLLYQAVDDIRAAADSVSMSGCGSYKTIVIDTNQLDSAIGAYSINITGDGNSPIEVVFSYYLQNGTHVKGKPIELPPHISVSCKDNDITLTKDCNNIYSSVSCSFPG